MRLIASKMPENGKEYRELSILKLNDIHTEDRCAEAQGQEDVCELRKTLCTRTLLDGFTRLSERESVDKPVHERLSAPLEIFNFDKKHF